MVDARLVDLCRIKEGHPELDRTMSSADRRFIVEDATSIKRVHAHQTESDTPELSTCGAASCPLGDEVTFSEDRHSNVYGRGTRCDLIEP